MMLSAIRFSNFRNHGATALEFGGGVNALFGANGEGKTNVLEAVSYLSLTKSFYASGDADALQIGKETFEIEGTMVSDLRVASQVAVRYQHIPSPAKSVRVNGTPTERLSSLIGMFPVVVLSPENNGITFGPPAERRKFVDLTLSQVSRAYLEDVLEYRRTLRQRNRLLADARIRGRMPDAELLEPWTLGLAQYGGRIAHRRRLFAEEFRSYMHNAYRDVAAGGEEPEMVYRCGFPADRADGAEAMSACMMTALEQGRNEEIKRGITLSGPHRDELALTLNGMSVQRFASQGQHKTFLVALKVAEFFYVRERRGEIPLFLLDDVFSELDARRAQRILAMAADVGQCMITATDDAIFRTTLQWGDTHRRFTVERGTCTRAA
ncbi:MAG: DNA replication/repair protein RecF [Bacteroidota bacterium]